MKPDPIVAEVRQAREAIARRYGNDPDKIYSAMKRAEAKDAWPRAKLSVVKQQSACVAEATASYGRYLAGQVSGQGAKPPR